LSLMIGYPRRGRRIDERLGRILGYLDSLLVSAVVIAPGFCAWL